MFKVRAALTGLSMGVALMSTYKELNAENIIPLTKAWNTSSVTKEGLTENFSDAQDIFLDFNKSANHDPEFPGSDTDLYDFTDIGKIIGADDRTQVMSTQSFPFRTIGQIEFRRYSDDSARICTGFLVGPRHVLTAGHCLFEYRDSRAYGWNHSFKFTPGRSNSIVKPYGSIGWARAVSVEGYTNDGDRDYDYGMLILSEDVGDRTGWLGYGYRENLKGSLVNVIGYPGDKPSGTMWKDSCTISDYGISSTRFHYQCDTWGGQSGGPAYIYNSSEDSRTAYGINVAHYTSDDLPYNISKRINRAAFERIKNWKSEY